MSESLPKEAPQRASTRCFAISEILQLILDCALEDEHGYCTVARFALTSTSLKEPEPSLDALWEHLDSLAPLGKLILPSHKPMVKPGESVFEVRK